jgi:hypothetical protein
MQVVKNLFFLTKLLVEMVRTGKASAAIGGESVAHAAANGNGPREAATDDEDEALEGEAVCGLLGPNNHCECCISNNSLTLVSKGFSNSLHSTKCPRTFCTHSSPKSN